LISRVQIANFRGLKRVDVSLKPLTVLIGPNDSGKSSFLDALRFSRAPSLTQKEDWWRGQERPAVRLLVNPTDTFVGTFGFYRLPASGVAMVCPGSVGVPDFHEDGRLLAAVLDYLLRKDRARFDSIRLEAGRRIQGLNDIRIETPSPSERAVTVGLEGAFELAGERLSSGVRALLFFVALAYHPDRPDVVLIEEPENGLHPKRLQEVMEILRAITRGELSGKATQVILSTHSPYLLDHVRLPEDQVLVFRREDDGSRTVAEADVVGLKGFLAEFMLGEVWFNRGEEGLVAQAK
jgi:predicted ATPase